jgi:hypothetical protein
MFQSCRTTTLPLLAITVLATLCTPVVAQTTRPGGLAANGLGAGLAIGSGILGPAKSFAVTRQAAEALTLTPQQTQDVDAVLTQYESQARDLAAQALSIPPADLASQILQLIRSERARVANVLPVNLRMPFYHNLAELVVKQWVGPDGAVQKIILTDPTLTAAERQDLKRIDAATDASIKQILADPDIQSSLPDLVTALQDYRNQIMAVLTPQQQATARQRIGQGAGLLAQPESMTATPASPNPTTRPKTSAAAQVDSRSMMMAAGASPGSSAPISLADTGLEPLPATAAVGQAVPDLHLLNFAGNSIALPAVCRDKITLLEFGSYSSPAFRQRVDPMKKLVASYGTRIQFFIVYTREAHPIGDEQTGQNKTDGVLVEQPTDAAARHRLAADARLALTLTSPMLMDSMDNALERTLGGFPNASIIIGPNSTIVARQQWTDPSGLRELLDDALATPAATDKPANP